MGSPHFGHILGLRGAIPTGEPQPAQNFVSDVNGRPQLRQFIEGTALMYTMGVPHTAQNLLFAIMGAPHFEHVCCTEAKGVAGVPQFAQNFAPATRGAPHFRQAADRFTG
jgi:hypothetical protein